MVAKAYRLPPLVPLTDATGCGLWHTPRANDAKKGGDFDATNPRNGLPAAVKMWRTPQSGDARACLTGTQSQLMLAHQAANGERHSPNLNELAAPGGRLNPTWVEWLMGFPLGWTELPRSETPLSRKSSKR